jgi:SAM-dependent methyltransferase
VTSVGDPTILARIHDGYVHRRRTRVLTDQLEPLLPAHGRVLDVGCGDGLISHLIQQRRPDLVVEGIDVMARAGAHIPVRQFDGSAIPYADKSVDAVMFVDVLHHSVDPTVLLAEAARVSRGLVIIKDHTLNGLLAGPTLRFMDWVGNAHHGVVLPYNYWPKERWARAFEALDLRVEIQTSRLPLYPPPANWIFGRGLHFLAKLRVARSN